MRDGTPMPVPPEGFLIRQRVLHVFTEANRVNKSCIALQDNDTGTFGRLMNASHESCDNNYGLSTPELNKLVSIMRSHGAAGARLTGAGFGGCAVALAKDSDIRAIMQGVKDRYYNDYIRNEHPEIEITDSTDDVLFAVKPSAGATVRYL